mgnify:CR=1 FL=1
MLGAWGVATTSAGGGTLARAGAGGRGVLMTTGGVGAAQAARQAARQSRVRRMGCIGI